MGKRGAGKGGLPYHTLAGAAKLSLKERYLMRTGRMHGKSGKRERQIVVMRDQVRQQRQQAEASGSGSGGGSAGMSGAELDSGANGGSVPSADAPTQPPAADPTAAVATPAAKAFVASLRAELGGKT